MAGDSQAEPVCLVDDRLHFLERERRAVDERRVRSPHVHRADEILGRIDLDPVDAVQLCLAHCGAREPRRIGVLVFRESLVIAQRLQVRVEVGGALIYRLADHLHARPEEHARVDCVADLDGVESAARVHVENGGEAGPRSACPLASAISVGLDGESGWFRLRWTWPSIIPGNTVAEPRSITVAPAGTGRPAPTSAMRSPRTMMTGFASILPDLESNSRAARMATT